MDIKTLNNHLSSNLSFTEETTDEELHTNYQTLDFCEFLFVNGILFSTWTFF